MLGIPGATVATVAFTPQGIVVGLRRRRRRLRCPCGWETPAAYDRSVRRWRHLDLGACKLYLEADIRRLRCRRCARVRTEDVPWARPGARLTPRPRGPGRVHQPSQGRTHRSRQFKPGYIGPAVGSALSPRTSFKTCATKSRYSGLMKKSSFSHGWFG
jgi:hypothetical protein